MFDELFNTEDNTSIDILLKLIDKLDIETKTELEMPQIKIITISKWFELRSKEENKNKTKEELMIKAFEYYMLLKYSYKRKRSEEIIKGLSEMKEIFLEQIQKNKELNK